MSDNFLVKTEIFQGPLDLLLTLIQKRKLQINEISLARITDDYLDFIKNSEERTLKSNSDFILVASTLLLIKSKSLLPTLDLTMEEETDIEELETKLKIFKLIKETEEFLLNKFCKNIIYFKSENKLEESVFAPPKEIDIGIISDSIRNIVNNIPAPLDKKPEVKIRKIVSLEETITNLTERLKRNIQMTFKDFSRIGKEEKINVVVSFLAMLQLVKDGIIEVNQDSNYSEIKMESTDCDVPSYI